MARAAEAREARVKMCALLEKTPTVLPPQACAPSALVDPANDPRRAVFQAAVPRVNACLTKAVDFANMSLEIDIADSGTVTAARASVGIPEVNACIEQVLRSLTFPPHYPGTWRVNSKRP